MPWRFYTARGEEKQAAFPANSDVSFGGYKATLLGTPTAAQDAATKAYVDARAEVEGTTDFSALIGDYTIPNGSWASPGWYTPIIVGPNQSWELTAQSPYRCVTAVHPIFHRIGTRDAAGAALGAGYTGVARASIQQPTAITLNFTDIIMGRIFTDGSVSAGTTLRIVQEYNGQGANGRVLRDGSYYWVQAWRRA